MLSFLKHVEGDLPSSDIKFWRRASDPVLAHDPFSTLMWSLFCLPSPFLSCEESLLSLVHAFYIVTVTQVGHLAFKFFTYGFSVILLIFIACTSQCRLSFCIMSKPSIS